MAKKQTHRRDGIYERADRPGFWGSWIDASGRRVQHKLNAPTLTQAKQLLADEKARVAKQLATGQVEPSKNSFAEFADVFVKHQERRIAPRVAKGKISQAEYTRQKGIVEKHLKPFFGSMKLALIRKKNVSDYIDSRVGKVGDGTIIKEIGTLKHLFGVAVEKEMIAANPAHRAPVPKAPEGRVRYLSAEELGNVLRACPAWLRPIVGLLVSTGARRGEMLRAKWEDVNIRLREIRLRHTKSGKERPAFINDLAMQVLLSMGADTHKRKGPLFPGVTPARVTVAFIRACKDAGVEDFSIHDLRHHYAAMLRQNGVDLHTLQKLLGHSDPRMTDRYAHLSQPFLLDAAKRLDGVLSLTPATENKADS
ncbi:MAG: tyrosine-type recombinase/integrase [Terracidiphilus sp.]